MTQPMYYRDLIGYPPAPAAAVEFALIHRDMKKEFETQGWLFFPADFDAGLIDPMLKHLIIRSNYLTSAAQS